MVLLTPVTVVALNNGWGGLTLLAIVRAIFKSGDFLSRDSFPSTAWLTRTNPIILSLRILTGSERKTKVEANRAAQFIMRLICGRSDVAMFPY